MLFYADFVLDLHKYLSLNPETCRDSSWKESENPPLLKEC